MFQTPNLQHVLISVCQGDVSKLTFNAPSELPSFLPHTPLRKQDTLEVSICGTCYTWWVSNCGNVLKWAWVWS